MARIVKPVGARVLVEDIITTLDIKERGRKSGLEIIVGERDQPQATQGKVIAVGTDAMLAEVGIKEGTIVHFDRLAGRFQWLEGAQYRSLEFQEIIMVDNEEPTA